jgi:transcription factor C subunit 6
MDGYSRMTNLLSPFADTIPNNRSRVASTSITYVDALHSIVSCEEGTWTKFFPIRRFFSSTYVCKHAGAVRCVASSLFHTFILTGGSDGEAVFCNPVRRLFHSKIKNYQQTWFAIEFSQHTSLLRLTEGFKLEECETKGKAQKQLLTTVFPPEICISSVCWNGNRNFAGWAAAGSSCGLVRVQDVAIG